LKFSDYPLSPPLKANIARQGWRRPTDIQYRAIRPILEGEDVLAIAQTGTGKTAAFAIPVLQRLQERKESQWRETGIGCLVMVPTRELTQQLTGVFTELARNTGVNVLGITGGVDIDPQLAGLTRELDVLITTPGRMYDLLGRNVLRLERVRTLILDEADLMLDLGFIEDIRGVIGHLKKKHQTLFFSATINEQIKKLAYSLVRNPIRIRISPKDPVSKNVDHAVIFVDMDDKRVLLERFVKENPEAKMLVFARTQVRCERIAAAMGRVGIPTAVLHGELEQSDRDRALAAFRKGEERVMIATDVSARGIDIPDVSHVINYDLPEQADNYVHRVGRTGRGKRRGLAFTFCAPREMELLRRIETYTGHTIRIVEVDRATLRETRELSALDQMGLDDLIEEIERVGKKKKGKR
jgi:ATP-dependent RNA helicase RhlE